MISLAQGLGGKAHIPGNEWLGKDMPAGGYDTPQQSVLDWKRQLARVLVANKDHRTEGKKEVEKGVGCGGLG